VFVFLGAVIAGGKVVKTISGDLVPAELFAASPWLVISVLLACACSLLLANLLGVPQSTSQSTVAAIAGAGIYCGHLKTHRLLLEIIPVWFITPLLAFFISYFIGRLLWRRVRDSESYRKFNRSKGLKFFVVAVSCYVAFAIGANNVANAAGPIVAMGVVDALLGMIIIAPWFGIGSSFLSGKVIKTTGKEIVEYGPAAAGLICVVTATILLLVSVTRGIPTSLVQMNTGAIIGVGAVKLGFRGIVKRKSLWRVFGVWFAAPCISMVLAYFFCAISGV